jgi:hypothetical protein
VGEDSIEKIVKKKGVSWKGKNELFKSGTFYNFCMPSAFAEGNGEGI